MRYIFLIYENEVIAAQRTEQEQMAVYERYFTFTELVRSEGVYEAGDPLEETATSTTVRIREGSILNTDGPFAETKEQLGGYYILDCADLDQALAYAAKIPTAEHGSIEVRPIMQLPG